MPITYTNRKGFTYTLCRGTTKTGKPRYTFSCEPKDEPVEQIPEGYAISESVNGIVSLSKERPNQLRPKEVEAVNAVLARHPLKRKYRVGLKPNRIDIYELVAGFARHQRDIEKGWPLGELRPGASAPLD